MAEHPIAVRFGIVCDQVRREDNGKLLIIGAYGHSIDVSALPVNLMLTLVIGTWSKKPVTDYPIEVRASFSGEPIHSGSGTIALKEAGSDLLILPNIFVSASRAGELEFKAKLGADRWKVITTIPVRENV
jgi:hypothetical protein